MAQARTGKHKRVLWALLGLLVLLLLVLPGLHAADILPSLERWLRDLGPWGPILFVAAIFVGQPLLFPNTIFGIAAGAVFGLLPGFAYYFTGVYLSNLLVYGLGRRCLQGPVLRVLERRPSILAAVEAACREGTSLVFWIRMTPLSPAVFSYAFGAVRVPFRSLLVGSFGMGTHLFLDVYLGTVAAHVLSQPTQESWGAKIAGLLLGLAGLLGLSWKLARLARAHVLAAEAENEP